MNTNQSNRQEDKMSHQKSMGIGSGKNVIDVKQGINNRYQAIKNKFLQYKQNSRNAEIKTRSRNVGDKPEGLGIH